MAYHFIALEGVGDRRIKLGIMHPRGSLIRRRLGRLWRKLKV
ncbi:hypothetical protein P7H16_15270 [Paenibacillus larvae]|nr:hypothetical protein [Paenibacillus larvae]MDT2248016.1 hypothetical protein [Paenibacillus larvae]